MKDELVRTVNSAAAATGCTARVDIRESYPGVVNDDEQTRLVYRRARELFGADNAVVLDEPTMTTEDFGYYLDKAPGCFFHVGAGCAYPLHSGRMDPDEEAIRTAAAMHIAMATT